ncbi:hypothetical protein F5Y16DRAFT_420403 [Xylariaceae sp. FL0255]|nr:hypothetical protein F5Y16DRAFT_420403 [Xylariaceae sp. FL0255]
MQHLPFVEVRDLPPSASFYSAVTQPLGLKFLSADSSSIIYGDTTEPLFRVAVVSHPSFRPARLVVSADSPAVVSAFYAAARRANPGPIPPGDFLQTPDRDVPAETETRARITDLDGNIMEVVHVKPPGYPSHYEGSTVRRTQSTTKEVNRILDWNFDVATSVGAPAPAEAERERERALADDGPFRYMRRTVTMSTVETPHAQPPSQQNGLSTGAMVGTVLGAVAAGAVVGAGLTYAFSRSERNRAPLQDFYAPPPMQRRATYPDPYPDHHPRYVERTVEKIHFPDQYPSSSRKYPPPAYVTRYSQVDGPTASRVNDDADERASHYKGCSRAGSRSRAGSVRRPLMITDAEHRSNVDTQYIDQPKLLTEAEHRSVAGSKHSAVRSKVYSEVADNRSGAPTKVYAEPARSHVSSRHHSRHDDDGDHRSHVSHRSKATSHRDLDKQSYVSARSEKSESTVRPGRSRAPSRHSAATAVKTSRAPTYVSARDEPPPRGMAAVDIDDAGSVAPSDSISCVGGSRHHRPRPHPRDLPFLEGIRERLIIEDVTNVSWDMATYGLHKGNNYDRHFLMGF